MASTLVPIESGGPEGVQQMCRLCMGEENLEDVFKEHNLHQWISNYLWITVSSDDRKGHTVCIICRLRLAEFHQFHIRCQEVQAILQSMVRDEYGTSTRLGENIDLQHVKTEPCEQVDINNGAELSKDLRSNTGTQISVDGFGHDSSELQLPSVSVEFKPDIANDHARDDHLKLYQDDDGYGQSVSAQDEIVVHQVKIEAMVHDEEPQDESDKSVGKFQCSTCAKTYRTRRLLVGHNRRVHGPKNHICRICGIGFSYGIDLQKHELTNMHLLRVQANPELKLRIDNEKTNDIYTCWKCNRTFDQKRDLKKHARSHDAKLNKKKAAQSRDEQLETDKAVVSTKISEKRKPSETEEKGRTDEKWRCNQCGRSFPSGDKLRCHMRCHAKSVVCPICGKPFANQVTLNRHIPVHDPNRARPSRASESAGGPFRCDICQKEFALKSTLRSHKPKVHGPRRYPCHLCDKKFGTSSVLAHHVRRHYGDGRISKKDQSGSAKIACSSQSIDLGTNSSS